MRGKVVLLCFWATGPRQCQAALPPIVSAYRRLHGAGLEVIGISLDTDKGALLNYIAANGMPWPEYFDGKGWSNGISSQLGIHALPTIWLLDKKGYVRATSNNTTGLEEQAERLLAEQ
jgi:peroxiredoxin